MRKWGALAVGLAMVVSLGIPTQAVGDNLDSCRISASNRQTVSLGFPFRAERLKWLTKVKILVVPFQLKDNPNYLFTNSMRNDYLTAGDNIASFSNGLTKVEFVFAPTIPTELTNSDMDQLKINQREAWQKDESKSTYGFVRKFLKDYDPKLDFTGINGVILAGSSTSPFSDIAEAFMFWNSPDAGWFRPADTAEGQIYNAVLLDNHSSSATITHEMMHLFGLQDLYGTDTGPGRLSLMASNEINLLSYEKWVLGWLPDSDVQCFANISSSNIYRFTFDYSKTNQIAVIPTDGDPYIVETTKVNGRRYLAFYSLNNDGRPPITLYQKKTEAQNGGTEIEDYTVIGTQLVSPKYTLLVNNLDSSSITLYLSPSSQVTSGEFKDLVAKSEEIRAKFQQEELNKSRAAAELKAKEEAEAKAVADLKAKQEAEAKAAAELKAKQEEAAKNANSTASKKTTITCVKGKIIKKVTAVNPKCPTGYKKK